MYAAIIAGGSGTRLWPSSRREKPKQFHNLYGEHTLLQESVRRLEPLIKQEDIYIIANRAHESIVREQLPWLGKENFIGEPVGKNTAPAVGVIASIINKKDPDGVILISPADHIIAKEAIFRRILEVGNEVASEGPNTVTIGIKPTYSATGYGYIQMSESKKTHKEIDVHKAFSFKEKPDAKTAEEYVASWSYVWNSGMFMWSAKTIMHLFKEHAPDIYKLLARYEGALGTPEEAKVFDEMYEAFPSISIDYAILEHAHNIFVIPASIGWNDLGSWASLHDIMEKDEEGNAVKGKHVGVDTHNCLIHSKDRLIATVGLENMIVVDTGDVVLILPANRSQEIKSLLDELKKRGKGQYL
ncbi:MAG: mannose-1-phosphate guanylyltransferase [Armatimonadetes bacterium]|nr:mannose-1-phosphate guanylyltransferase [Armatimonadota bacterium]